MKKIFIILGWAQILLLVSGAGFCFAGEVDVLIDKLVEKGILSHTEGEQLAQEALNEKEKEKEKEKVESKGISIPKLTERINFYGDLRLRYDTQWIEDDKNDYDRNRGRFRLRFGLKAKTTETTEIGMRLASGSGYQNTTNQSFDGHARGKDIFIDRAYASWKPYDSFKIIGGKQKNPLFTSSLVWDSDVNPEGLSEQFKYKINDQINIYSNLGQWMIEELSLKDSDRDPTMLVFQLGSKIKASDKIKIELAGAYYDFKNLDKLEWEAGILSDKEDFLGYNNKHGQQMIFDGNNELLNEFKCWQIDTKIKVKNVLPVPFSIFGTYIINTEADVDKLVRKGVDPGDSDPADLLSYSGDDRDTGWQLGFSVGNKKKKGDWYAKYFYQELEDYAFPAVFVDSDFHGGGTNNKGHCIQGRYFLTDNIQARATGFFTEREDEDKNGKRDEDRLQLDMIFQF